MSKKAEKISIFSLRGIMIFLTIRTKLLNKRFKKFKRANVYEFSYMRYATDFFEQANKDHEDYQAHLRNVKGFFKSFIPNTHENKIRLRCARSLKHAEDALNTLLKY